MKKINYKEDQRDIVEELKKELDGFKDNAESLKDLDIEWDDGETVYRYPSPNALDKMAHKYATLEYIGATPKFNIELIGNYNLDTKKVRISISKIEKSSKFVTPKESSCAQI